MAVFITKQLEAPIFVKALSDYAVGESVFLNVNGVKTEFLVVNQGLPSSDYDSSCDGTWLLMKEIDGSMAWGSTGVVSYGGSFVHKYLNGEFINSLDYNIQNAIKTVNIPIAVSHFSEYGDLHERSSIDAKAFLLSYAEVGFSSDITEIERTAVLSYFDGATASDRIAYDHRGYAYSWWLRTHTSFAATSEDIHKITMVNESGSGGNSLRADGLGYVSRGVRPCVIMPYDTIFDPDTNEVIA